MKTESIAELHLKCLRLEAKVLKYKAKATKDPDRKALLLAKSKETYLRAEQIIRRLCRDLKNDPETKQILIITDLAESGFSLWHKHRDFTEEGYGARSVKGLLNQIENILNGYQPDVSDSYRNDDGCPDIHCSSRRCPKPLD